MKQFRISCLLAAMFCVGVAPAAEPLHQRIDRLIARQQTGSVSQRTDDAEFLRRAYLDLIGRIPARDEAAAFLDDERDDKRQQLIDQLLADGEYATHMANVLDVMLMERRGEHADWQSFLVDACRRNKPWDQLVREILDPDMHNERTRGSAFFYTKRLERYGQNPNDMPGLVRDLGRMFLGIDVQCAQCHDHLFVDDYKQTDWQGLFAFVGHTGIRRDKDFPAVAEQPLLEKITFASVFDMEPMQIGPRLPGGEEAVIPVFARGEEFAVAPDRKKREPGIPKFRTLELLSKQLPTADNPAFSRNAVNRFWWLMTGAGLVEPLDMHHSGNPPSHPELLELLSEEFVAHEFDIKWLLREIALTATYQRSSVLPAGSAVPSESRTYETALERRLSAEQLLRSMLQAAGGPEPRPDEQAAGQREGAEDLSELRERFRKVFANPPKEPELGISPTVKAALFLMNDEVLQTWLEPRKGNLIDRLLKLEDGVEIAEELYLSILSRRPAEEELRAVTGLLAGQPEARERILRNAAWALLSCAEFTVNH